jgi:large subunit ribosomal protein L29
MPKSESTVLAKELRKRADAELRSLLSAKIEELQKARFKHALGQLRETHTLKVLKRDISRLRTVLTEKGRGKAEAADKRAG